MRAFLYAYGGIRAATVLHEKLLRSILRAPVAFFDVTPVGGWLGPKCLMGFCLFYVTFSFTLCRLEGL